MAQRERLAMLALRRLASATVECHSQQGSVVLWSPDVTLGRATVR